MRNPIRIVILTPVWRRPEIFEICLKGIKRLQEYAPKRFEIIPFFVVSELEAKQQVKEYGFDYMFHENYPLGAKKNAGLRLIMLRYKFDYLLEMGSDNLLTNDYLDFLEPFMKERTPQITPSDVWFVDTQTGKVAFWRTNKVLGCGRCIHYDSLMVIKKNNRELWTPERNRGMDTCSWMMLRGYEIQNTIVKADKIYGLDIKSEVNINQIVKFMRTAKSIEEILNRFPERDMIYKLIKNDTAL